MSLDLWQAGCERLATEMPEHQFNTWIRPLPPATVQTDSEGAAIVSVQVPNRFKLDWIRAQYAGRIETVLARSSASPCGWTSRWLRATPAGPGQHRGPQRAAGAGPAGSSAGRRGPWRWRP
jgi:chromosomal replication initiator protein